VGLRCRTLCLFLFCFGSQHSDVVFCCVFVFWILVGGFSFAFGSHCLVLARATMASAVFCFFICM